MKKRYWVTAIILSGSIVVAGVAAACGGPGGRMGGDHGPRGKMMQMMHELDLSDEQQSQIWKIVDEKRGDMLEAMKAGRTNREEMREMMQSGTYDAEKVKVLANQQGEQVANRIEKRAEVMNAIRQVLTDEQVAQLVEMKHSRHERAPW